VGVTVGVTVGVIVGVMVTVGVGVGVGHVDVPVITPDELVTQHVVPSK
jgi:hypothetical protein